MVLYYCDKCNKTFSKRYNYLMHINRKTPCSNENENDNENEEINELSCKYCNKEFSRKDNLKRHLITCKGNDELVVALKSKIDFMCEKISSLEKHMNKGAKKIITNNNNLQQNITNNNQNNINMYFPNNIIPLGKEDISFLSNKNLINMLKIMKVEEIHSRLIELINFNKALDNNQNVIKYKNKLYLSLELDGKTKDKIVKTNTIDELTEKYIKRNIDLIEDKISELKEGNNNDILKIENKVNKYNEETDKIIYYLDNNNNEDKVTRDKIKKVKNNVEKMIIESELNKMLKA
jgi:enoyl reductase-like protein